MCLFIVLGQSDFKQPHFITLIMAKYFYFRTVVSYATEAMPIYSKDAVVNAGRYSLLLSNNKHMNHNVLIKIVSSLRVNTQEKFRNSQSFLTGLDGKAHELLFL